MSSNVGLDAQELVLQVERAVATAVARIAAFSGVDLPEVSIDFSLKGHCAGQARLVGKALQLRINLPLLARYRDDYLTTTIPHEVAHLYLLWACRSRRHKPQPHGLEWQRVMRDCFRLEPTRCHSYETRPARVVRRSFLYACSCREHRLTRIMHNRVRKSGRHVCKYCKGVLHFRRQID